MFNSQLLQIFFFVLFLVSMFLVWVAVSQYRKENEQLKKELESLSEAYIKETQKFQNELKELMEEKVTNYQTLEKLQKNTAHNLSVVIEQLQEKDKEIKILREVVKLAPVRLSNGRFSKRG